MRARLSSLLLAFCLVFSQQGALLHALRHELPHAGAASDDAESHPAGAGCVTCLAFARRPADVPRARARDPPGFF